MHPLRKQRLIVVCIIVIGASVAAMLIASALKQNLNLFYDPSSVAAGDAPIGRKIRIGGMVVKDSLERVPDSLTVLFKVTDYHAEVQIEYTGILPDMFAEQEGAIATGQLNGSGIFIAEQVLAKHDENYMPPEVAESLKAKKKINSATIERNSELTNEPILIPFTEGANEQSNYN